MGTEEYPWVVTRIYVGGQSQANNIEVGDIIYAVNGTIITPGNLSMIDDEILQARKGCHAIILRLPDIKSILEKSNKLGNIVVSSAGSDEANGTYTPLGYDNSNPRWINERKILPRSVDITLNDDRYLSIGIMEKEIYYGAWSPESIVLHG